MLAKFEVLSVTEMAGGESCRFFDAENEPAAKIIYYVRFWSNFKLNGQKIDTLAKFMNLLSGNGSFFIIFENGVV